MVGCLGGADLVGPGGIADLVGSGGIADLVGCPAAGGFRAGPSRPVCRAVAACGYVLGVLTVPGHLPQSHSW
ncbi:hypothetical protein IQ62_33380 [Streptomyces scabiei]|nr:hypothetical protein IQ62_33380 [Streptomyces scabiei]